jgi:hypothetical protein
MGSVDDWLDDHDVKVRVSLIFGSVMFIWPFMPVVNPIWSALFALPFWLVVVEFQPHPVYADHPWTEIAAFLLWPPILFGLLIWLSGKLVASRSGLRKHIILLWALSCLILAPPEFLTQLLGSRRPMFGIYD